MCVCVIVCECVCVSSQFQPKLYWCRDCSNSLQETFFIKFKNCSILVVGMWRVFRFSLCKTICKNIIFRELFKFNTNTTILGKKGWLDIEARQDGSAKMTSQYSYSSSYYMQLMKRLDQNGSSLNYLFFSFVVNTQEKWVSTTTFQKA